MKALHYTIIEVDQEYLNEIKGKNSSLVMNTTIESVEHINRIGKVVAAPKGTVLLPGDEVVVHHNITRINNGHGGFPIRSEFWIKDNLFYVPATEIFAYCRDGLWTALAPFCFIKPVPMDTQYHNGILMSPEALKQEISHKGMEKLKGLMWYSNQDLIDLGIKQGDEVLFSEDSEYEFKFPGEGILYKMSTKDILGTI